MHHFTVCYSLDTVVLRQFMAWKLDSQWWNLSEVEFGGKSLRVEPSEEINVVLRELYLVPMRQVLLKSKTGFSPLSPVSCLVTDVSVLPPSHWHAHHDATCHAMMQSVPLNRTRSMLSGFSASKTVIMRNLKYK